MCKFPDLGSPERVKMKEELKKNSSKCAYVIIELVSYQPSVHARRLQYSVVYVLISVSVTSTMKPCSSGDLNYVQIILSSVFIFLYSQKDDKICS